MRWFDRIDFKWASKEDPSFDVGEDGAPTEAGNWRADDAQSRSWTGKTMQEEQLAEERVLDGCCAGAISQLGWAPRQKTGRSDRPLPIQTPLTLLRLALSTSTTATASLYGIDSHTIFAHTVSRPSFAYTQLPRHLASFSTTSFAHLGASESCFCRLSYGVPTLQKLAVAVDRLESASLTTRHRLHHLTREVTRF